MRGVTRAVLNDWGKQPPPGRRDLNKSMILLVFQSLCSRYLLNILLVIEPSALHRIELCRPLQAYYV